MQSLIALALLAGVAAAQPKSFAVEVTGSGKPLLLIPGLSSSGKVWDATVAHYKKKYRCHVLTIAGFAGRPPIPWQRDQFLSTVRDEIIGYIRDTKLDKPAIIGHSLGGFLTLWIAEQSPTLVGKLVIVDSLPFFGQVAREDATAENMKPAADQIRKTFASQTPEQVEQGSDASIRPMVTSDADFELVKGWGRASDHATVGEALAELFSTDLRPGLARINSSVLVMATWIGYQQYATREQVEKRFRAQYAGLPAYELVMFDHARHFIMLDDPDGFLKTADAFLNK